MKRHGCIQSHRLSQDVQKAHKTAIYIIPNLAENHIFWWNFCFSSYMGFPGGSDGKECAYNAGDQGSIPG